MKIEIPASNDLKLSISNEQDGHSKYPTARLQKGLLLHYRSENLAEEAVGFGLPVIKCGLQSIFPGNVDLSVQAPDPFWVISADYKLNLVEKLARPNSAILKGKSFYTLKNIMAALLRQCPPLRAPLTILSSSLRRVFGWVTIYEAAETTNDLRLIYTVDPVKGNLSVKASTASSLSGTVTELILMNEQGAHYFDCYLDSSGNSLSGKQIGCWDEVNASRASFACTTYGISFSLSQQPGSRLFRGRELVDSRLAWSGFGISFPLSSREIYYSLDLARLP